MRVKVKAAEAGTIAEGPGTYVVTNHTASAAVFLETGAYEPASERSAPPAVSPDATEAAGYEWASNGPTLTITLAQHEVLRGIVKAAGAEQELHVLRTSPHF